MKYTIYILLFFAFNLDAQHNQTVYLGVEEYSIEKAKDELTDICLHLGLRNDYKIVINNQLSAIAKPTIHGNRRQIHINVYGMQYIYEQSGRNRYSTIGVLLHELAHVFNNDVTNIHSRSPISMEAKADYFAGFQLQRMGATLEDAISFTHFFEALDNANLRNGHLHQSHPVRATRIHQVTKGWNTAKSLTINQ